MTGGPALRGGPGLVPGAGPPSLEAKRVRHFCRLLTGHATKRIEHESLWAYFAEAFPDRPPTAERAWLLAALRSAEAAGAIVIPPERGARWDATRHPAVPRSVERVTAPLPPKDESWRTAPWPPPLAWVASLPALTGEQAAFLRRVQRGLAENAFREVVPLKHRSLQLTGDEKRLAILAAGRLFEEGRLTLALLGCEPEPTPITWESVGPAPAAVIFENADAYAVALRVLRAASGGARRYGIVAYGAGRAVERSVAWLATIGRSVEQLHYLGDLDWPGLEMATGAGRRAFDAGLPPLAPLPGGHARMLVAANVLGAPLGWADPDRRAPAALERCLAWLGEDAREGVRRVLDAGNRIPEEVLAPTDLCTLLLERREPSRRRRA